MKYAARWGRPDNDYSVSGLDVHMMVCSGLRIFNSGIRPDSRFIWQASHIGFQPLPVFGRKRYFQPICKPTLQGALPARFQIVQIGPPAV